MLSFVILQEYYDDWENISDPPDAGEIDDRNSDSSDFEETYIKKKKKKSKVSGVIIALYWFQ